MHVPWKLFIPLYQNRLTSAGEKQRISIHVCRVYVNAELLCMLGVLDQFWLTLKKLSRVDLDGRPLGNLIAVDNPGKPQSILEEHSGKPLFILLPNNQPGYVC